jgi:hypothetical protein
MWPEAMQGVRAGVRKIPNNRQEVQPNRCTIKHSRRDTICGRDHNNPLTAEFCSPNGPTKDPQPDCTGTAGACELADSQFYDKSENLGNIGGLNEETPSQGAGRRPSSRPPVSKAPFLESLLFCCRARRSTRVQQQKCCTVPAPPQPNRSIGGGLGMSCAIVGSYSKTSTTRPAACSRPIHVRNISKIQLQLKNDMSSTKRFRNSSESQQESKAGPRARFLISRFASIQARLRVEKSAECSQGGGGIAAAAALALEHAAQHKGGMHQLQDR